MLRRIGGRKMRSGGVATQGIIGAVREQVAQAQRTELNLEGQLQAVPASASMQAAKEELALSKMAVRRWVRKLRAHEESLETVQSELMESHTALRALRAIIDGKAEAVAMVDSSKREKKASRHRGGEGEEGEGEEEGEDEEEEEESEEEESEGE